MIKTGDYNKLIPYRKEQHGLIMIEEDSEGDEEVLLPTKFIPEDLKFGDTLELFVFLNNEEEYTATTQIPYARCNEFAYLRVKENSRYGSFVDLGVDKDLLVPFREQNTDLEEGKKYLVYVHFDEESQRLVGSSRVQGKLRKIENELRAGEQVDIIIWKKTDIGIKCIINHSFEGLLFKNEVFQELRIGQKEIAFIKQIRPDGKIDLSLQQVGHEQIEPNAQKVLQLLQRNNGYTRITDKSAPEQIYSAFNMSKKMFKKAVGNLYRQRIIEIKPDGICLKQEMKNEEE